MTTGIPDPGWDTGKIKISSVHRCIGATVGYSPTVNKPTTPFASEGGLLGFAAMSRRPF